MTSDFFSVSSRSVESKCERTLLQVTSAVTTYIAQSITDWKCRFNSLPSGHCAVCSIALQVAGVTIPSIFPRPQPMSIRSDFTTEAATAWVMMCTDDIHRRLWGRGKAAWRVSWHEWCQAPPLRWQRMAGKFWDEFEDFISSFCGTPFPIFTPYFGLKQWKHAYCALHI